MSAASAVKLGINADVLRNSATYGTPTWAELTLVRGVTPAFPWDMVDAAIRGTPVKLYAKSQLDIQLQLDVRADDADAGYQALWDAAMDQDSVVDLLVLDGPITTEGSMGVRGEFVVNFAGQSQGPGDVVYTQFDLKPAWSSNGYPKKVEMGASSAPTFTAF